MLDDERIIELLKALADPNRLRLFDLLLASDRTNSELIDQTGLRQNLLSHHLAILTGSGLIKEHRSIGDARRHYFFVDLNVACLLREWCEAHSPREQSVLPTLKRPRQVLFLCYQNATRSIFAEALARQLAPQALIPYSAGIKAADSPIPAVTFQVLAAHDLPTDFTPKTVEMLAGIQFDYVIAVCDIVHEYLFPPVLEGIPYIHWSLIDPVNAAHSEARQLAAARALFDDLSLRIRFLVQRLADQEAGETP
jgi:protein-tyrosine-phosphatase/DNA-binding transcriptional ArsR family regulator